MNHERQPRLKPLLDRVPPGFLVDARYLCGRGIDRKSIHGYVARGWLERLVRGVYRRPLPAGTGERGEVRWESVLLSLQRIMGHDVHLGGVSALELAGHVHYLHLGGNPPVHVYGPVPSWLRRLPCDAVFVTHRLGLFGGDRNGIVEDGRRGDVAGAWRWPLRASCPERAVLEALDGISGEAGFDRMDRMFESLTVMRPKLLTELLAACRSVKVRRLFFVFADRHRPAWRKHLDSGKIDFGSGPRALVKGCRLHPAYRIQVPDGFMPKDDRNA